MLRKIKHVTALTALAASANAVTLEQPTEVALEDMVDTTNLALREGSGLEDYADAPKTVTTLVETVKDIAFSFKSEKTLKAVQELA